MTLDQTLDALRELGVLIPEGLDDAQLTNLGKSLIPWTVSIYPFNGQFVATTNSSWFMNLPKEGEETDNSWIDGQSAAGANTPAYAVMLLLLQQLQNGRYSAHDTRYKIAARQRHN